VDDGLWRQRLDIHDPRNQLHHTGTPHQALGQRVTSHPGRAAEDGRLTGSTHVIQHDLPTVAGGLLWGEVSHRR
jgi:hypothetical protein